MTDPRKTASILCTAHFGVDLPFHGLDLVPLELGELLPLILGGFSPCNRASFFRVTPSSSPGWFMDICMSLRLHMPLLFARAIRF